MRKLKEKTEVFIGNNQTKIDYSTFRKNNKVDAEQEIKEYYDFENEGEKEAYIYGYMDGGLIGTNFFISDDFEEKYKDLQDDICSLESKVEYILRDVSETSKEVKELLKAIKDLSKRKSK